MEPQYVGVPRDSQRVEGERVAYATEYLNQNLLPVRKDNSGVLRNATDQGSPSYLFLLLWLPWIHQPLKTKA